MGVLDFAGGIVVHAIAGMATLAFVFYLGTWSVKEKGPHSIPLVALGTGFLWFGWYGFNAGSELKVNSVTAMAFLNTDLAASFTAITWLIVEWFQTKKPRFLGLLTGAVAGLATITPAAGFVTPGYAVLIGIIAGLVCYWAVSFKNRMGWDDALDVWEVHDVGGMTGVILLGLFASKVANPDGVNGLIFGGASFFGEEVAAVLGFSAYALVFTYLMLSVINFFTPVRVTEEEFGLDESIHGGNAYL